MRTLLPPAPAVAPWSTNEVRPLDAELVPDEVGGKAHVLSRLVALGEAVPAGVVIGRVVFNRWLEETALRAEIGRLADAIDPTDLASLREGASAIRHRVLTTPLPDHAARLIRSVAETMLGNSPLVVRSSGIGEDGATRSFAGQLDSILHVRTARQLEEAVLACWASYWSERVLSYRKSGGATLAGMGVIVQLQVDAAEAGVLFTRHPTESSGHFMLVESCPGLADGLVSGRIDPVSRMIPRTAADDDLAQTGLRLEAAFQGPQDIEWARDRQGKLWIVQSRPITTPVPAPSSPTSQVVWSNANVSENFPTPVSPLLYSIASSGYSHYFRNLALAFGISRARIRAMEMHFQSIIGLHGERIYYNLTSIHAILRMAPAGERLADAFNEFVGAPATPPVPAPAGANRWRRRLTEPLELARIAACTTRQYLFFRRRLESFERTVDAFAARTTPAALAERALPELAADLAGFIELRCHRWKNAGLADAAAMVCYALLQRALAAARAPASATNRLLRALPGVPSSEPPVRLWALSRLIRSQDALRELFATGTTSQIQERIENDPAFAGFRGELQRYLDDWGFRASSELMLTVPSFQEEPGPLFDLLRHYATTEGEPPEAAMASQAAGRVDETRRILRSLRWRAPLRALAIRGILHATQRSIAFRERARVKQALLYSRCRRIALAIGRRLVAAGQLQETNEVFMLTWSEITDVAAGREIFAEGLAGGIARRQHQHATRAALNPPDRIVLPAGAVYSAEPATVAPGGTRADPPGAHGDEPYPATLSGISACGGRSRAHAAVLTDVTESSKLRRGDILVTRQTDPGWGPIFGLVSGLVIERGGMLSHGAIIAREFGLPCVVGIAGASRIIPHRAMLTVDGDAGTCTIERPAPATEVRL